jgi:glycosyltransferase involved in cell wall biosynthesis
MKLSVNILCWNTVNTVKETLALLKEELSAIEHEIIIVDNGSKDGCQDLATIRNEVNLGISKGKNQGIDASSGDYVLLLDGDIVPVPNSIRLLCLHLDNNPDCQAIGFLPNKFSNQKNKDGQINHEKYCKVLDPIEEHFGHCVYFGLYRRDVFTRGVRFDEAYGIGYGFEDLDVYMQMKALGIKQWIAGINHRSGKYYHEINSSIRIGGFEWYMETSKKRSRMFKEKWGGVFVGACLT